VEARDLLVLLTGTTGAAADCREDLEHGGRLDTFPALVVTKELRAVYRRRAEHIDAQGGDAAGAFETADALDATSHTELALAKVSGGSSGRIFQLFLTPALDQVIACIALPEAS
jgi:hypothetical protein